MKVLKADAQIELTINKSRFIGRAFIVHTNDEVKGILERVKKQHWDASHNCFAFLLKDGGARFSDDGEPGQTAGLPIMEVIKKSDVVDALCVVTRYFGGVLLGAGGLVRAYTKAAAMAIEQAGASELVSCAVYKADVPYPMLSKIESVLQQSQARIDAMEYKENVTITLTIKKESAVSLLKKITDISSGTVLPELLREEELPFDAE